MRIIDTGRNRPKARFWDLFELQSNRKKLVQKPIIRQSRRDKTVLHGRFAVNQLLGRGYHRDTYDFDVFSPMPKAHALEIERSIDRGTDSNLAFVEQTRYKQGKPLFRVRTRFNTVESDFVHIPKNVDFVVRDGVRYESLNSARGKYKGMIDRGDVHRFPNAFFDLNDVETYNLIKKNRRRR